MISLKVIRASHWLYYLVTNLIKRIYFVVDLTFFYLNVELTLIMALKFLNANKRAINRGSTLLFDLSAFCTF